MPLKPGTTTVPGGVKRTGKEVEWVLDQRERTSSKAKVNQQREGFL